MRMMSLQDVLLYLRVGRTKLHELRRQNDFPRPALRVGKLMRWDVRDIDTWLELQRQQHTDQV
ncbi:MAG: helix-turn-helix transcriptional regulator [Geobacter sp.]